MNRRMNVIRGLSMVLVLSLGLSLAACGGGQEGGAPQSPAERAEARWQAMADGEFGKAWEFYSPGFRDLTPVEDFVADLQRRPLRWQSATIAGESCEGDRCTVKVEVTYSVPNGPQGIRDMESSRILEETWIRTEGQWWYSAE